MSENPEKIIKQPKHTILREIGVEITVLSFAEETRKEGERLIKERVDVESRKRRCLSVSGGYESRVMRAGAGVGAGAPATASLAGSE